MGNVLRVLAIVAVSMVLSLTALFLILFTICGGFQGSNNGAGWVVVGTGTLFAGGVALIVWLGRGLKASRPAGAPGTQAPGLAVPPAASAPAYYPGTAAPVSSAAPSAAVSVGPLTGTDGQLLNVLRAALGILAFLPMVMSAISYGRFQHITAGLGLQMAVQGVLNALPPAVLLIALIRNPPPGVGLDATAGMSIASILYRIGFFAWAFFAWPGFSLGNNMPALFLRLGLYSLLEIGIGVLALVVRRRVGPVNPGALVLAVFAFLVWDVVIQAAMTAMVRLLY
jgi:hypothetical protein